MQSSSHLCVCRCLAHPSLIEHIYSFTQTKPTSLSLNRGTETPQRCMRSIHPHLCQSVCPLRTKHTFVKQNTAGDNRPGQQVGYMAVCLSVCGASNVRRMNRRQSAHQHTNITREKNQTDNGMHQNTSIHQSTRLCLCGYTSMTSGRTAHRHTNLTPQQHQTPSIHRLIWWNG